MKIKDLIEVLKTLDGEQELFVIDEEYMDCGPIDGNRIQHSSVRYAYRNGELPYMDKPTKGYVAC